MKRIVVLGAAWLLILGLMPNVHAQPAGLFDARVEVESESDAERREAVRIGLTRVLQRLTGRDDLMEEPEVSEVVRDAERYLQQYGYRDRIDDDGERVQYLQLRYDGAAIERALVDRRIAVWTPEERPRTLVWMALDYGDGREIIGGDRGLAEQETLRRVAASSGLPVLVPLMDLEDQRALSTSDLWGGFREPVLDASERYRAGAVLAGRISWRENAWQARWLLFWDGESQEISATDEALDVVIEAGVSGAAAFLAQRLARVPDPDAGGVYYIRVEGVSSLADYARLQALFESTHGVATAGVQRVAGDYADFRVETEMEVGRIIDSMKRDGRIREADIGDEAETGNGADGLRRPDYFFRLP